VPVYVPSNYTGWVRTAANRTGLPYSIVAAQIAEESGFNPNAVSPAGAEGIAQFLPSTFYSVWHGSPFNVNDALEAYIRYMNQLLGIEGGSIYNALAAYNAGPGNIQAGFGYASTIFALAQSGVNTVAGHVSQTQGFNQPPSAPGSSDDWSQKVRNSASDISFAGANALSAGDAIRRI
jgi:soluble lytic murein transglycosylase-like protein